VSQVKPDQLKLIDVQAPTLRVLLLVPVILALVGSWYAGRWYAGNVLAEYAPNMEAGAIETAQTTTELAPDDPLTHWTVAALEQQALPPEQLSDALRQYEKAVSLSPNDYRLWVDLGRAREHAGNVAGGEKALRRAVELAPFYSEPRWLLGNLLLRAGRADEAFAELHRAAEQDPRLRPQVFNMAWYVYGQDVREISRAAGNSPAARADLAIYLLGHNRLDDALGQWDGLSAAEKLEQRTAGITLMKALLEAKRFHAALELFRDVEPKGATGVKEEQVVNGSFEGDVGLSDDHPFDWHVHSIAQAQIGIDERYRRSGNRSLRIRFQAPSALDFRTIGQVVVVEPATAYRLEFYVRTADLKSASTPLIQVQDGADGTVLGSSAPLAVGTSDWQSVTIDFKTGPKTEAVSIITGRGACESDTNTPCPIFGIVWYDDFNLQRGGSSSGGAAAADAGSQGRRANANGAANRNAR
jgi:tetratricopeptide (TPR) repeat protein